MRTATPTREDVIKIGDRRICLRTHRHRRARRMTLRFDPMDDCAVLTLPRSCSFTSGMEFAREKADWLLRRLDSLPPLTPFVDGAKIPFQGTELHLKYFPLAGTEPMLDGDSLYIPGAEEEMGDLTHSWLFQEAQTLMTALSAEKARRIGHAPPNVRLTDPRSRWGSCSETGRINFSWRLIMAPPEVLDYVVSHEVAHLEELNHGNKFESIVRSLADQVDDARAWLTDEGTGLLRYG